MKKLLLASATLLAITASSVSATVIDFDSRWSYDNPRSDEYTEDGYSFVSSYAGSNSFVTWGRLNDNWAGSAALFNCSLGASTTLYSTNGGVFDLNAIDISELVPAHVNINSYEETEITFTAVLAAGGDVSFVADLDLEFGFETFDFGSVFQGITSISWNQGQSVENSHQFDNLVISSIPEPVILALFGLGVIGFGVVRK